MSMPITFAVKVGLFSMRRRIIRTALTLLPCILLISVMFIGSTIPNGLVNELDNKVLKTAEDQQGLVVLGQYLFSQPDISTIGSSSGTVMTFNQQNYDLATKNEYVKEVYPQVGMITGTTAKLGNVDNANLTMNGVSKEFAKAYSPEEFVFTEGQPIPLILDVTGVGGQTINWGDGKSFTIDYTKPETMKDRTIYQNLKNQGDLVGQVIEVEFAKFPSLPEGFTEMQGGMTANKVKYTKLTQADNDILQKRVKEIFAPYWNLETLQQPTKYSFKIVALTQNQTGMGSMIPNDAVGAIWNKIYNKQKSARTSKVLDKEMIASNQQKVAMKDSKINASSIMSGNTQTIEKSADVSAWQVDISSISVPGLVVESVKNAKGQEEYRELVLPEISLSNFYPSGAVVRLKDPEMREDFGKYLNNNNMYFFDQSPLAIIKGIRKWSNIIVTWMTIILGIVVAFILLTTVSRFVADSRKEIGVWRAIGSTRFDIAKLVLARMSLLIVIGIAFGVSLGYVGSFFIAKGLAGQFNTATSSFDPYASPNATNIVSSMVIGLLGGNVPKLEMLNLLDTNWLLLASRLALLTLISLIIGLIPAIRATRISPITAIRDSE